MSAQKTASPTLGDSLDGDSKKLYQNTSDQESQAEQFGTTAAVIDHHAERALCRRFDFRLLPVLALMYLFNALDKGNLGNAKTDHLEANLGFKSNQYNIILSVFYVPYVLGAPPIVSIQVMKLGIRLELMIYRLCWERSLDLLEYCRF
jgi:hypothetical protein